MSRSSKKGPSVDERLIEKIVKAKNSSGKDIIKTWSRACMIVPDFIGMTIHVHDGRKFVPVYISEGMIGHRLGEFAITRTFRLHSGQRKAGVVKNGKK